MKTRRIFLYIVASILLLLLIPGVSGCRGGDLKKLDSVKLTDFDGVQHTMGDLLAGKTTLAANICLWDPVSKRQLMILNDLAAKYKDSNLAVMVFVMDVKNSESVIAYKTGLDCPYPFFPAYNRVKKVLGDEELVPVIFVIGKDRTLKKKIRGFIDETNLERILLKYMKSGEK